MNQKINILITVCNLSGIGGVSNHYLGLKPHWKHNVRYCVYGKRSYKTKRIFIPFLYIYDFLKFIYYLAFKKVDIVITNPSLRRFQIIRDGLFIFIASLFGKKTITFIHGWDYTYSKKLNNSRIFKHIYNKNTIIYVLFSEFRDLLRSLNITAPIHLTTTKVSDQLIESFSIEQRTHRRVINILFLARLIKEKGIYETIDAFRLLKSKYDYLNLIIGGDGSELSNAQQYAEENAIPDITFLGNVPVDQLNDVYAKADIYILPTYEEGMATSVLEAMAFGLPVISRPVGGIQDFWREQEMGFLVSSLKAADFADKIEYYIKNENAYQKTSIHNFHFAREHFLASKLTEKLEKDIIKIYDRE